MDSSKKFWRLSSEVFDQRAEEYDRWFDDGELFGIEREALLGLTTPLIGPKVEVGAGPGRFAAALGVDLGIDPAMAPLQIAAQRGVTPCRGIGEELPLTGNSCGAVFLLFTLCFLEDPRKALRECHRVLRPGGHLVIGMVPAESPWGAHLTAKREAGNPYYRQARFRTPAAVTQWLTECGLTVTEQRSTLHQPPGARVVAEQSRPGLSPDAGFVILVSEKGKAQSR
ncbi:MAG: methyltransferase domain-containing protein [Desulfobulbaceae bacterium]|nr:methyltransferase domain-containing protein [Desulfobulbaceae bacterium]